MLKNKGYCAARSLITTHPVGYGWQHPYASLRLFPSAMAQTQVGVSSLIIMFLKSVNLLSLNFRWYIYLIYFFSTLFLHINLFGKVQVSLNCT